MHVSAEHILSQCKTRWRELLFAAAVLVFSALALITGLFFGRPGWRVDDEALERLVIESQESLIADGPGQLASAEATPEEEKDAFFVVEDAATGKAIKRPRARGSDFKRWTRYKVLDHYEMAGRLVAGLKESKSVVIRIQPKGLHVPNVEQLREIAESVRSIEHHSTYVYFFLPGMDVKQSPWSTVFQQSNRPVSVSFDKTYVPELYRRFDEQVWK